MFPKYKNLSASGLVKTGAGTIRGVMVASSTGGTIKLWDNTSAAGTVIVNTTASITAPAFFPIEGSFTTGLYCTISGTADVTVFYN